MNVRLIIFCFFIMVSFISVSQNQLPLANGDFEDIDEDKNGKI